MAGGDRSNANTSLIAALAGGATMRQAALTVGVSERTVRRRMGEADFRAKLDRARGDLLSTTLGTLCDGTTLAARTLIDLLDADVPDNVRLRAAVAVIDLTSRLRAELTLDERVARLEFLLPPYA